MRLHIDRTGDEEQRDLAGGVHDDMECRAGGGHLRCDGGAENDVGQLTDRRIGKTRFQVVLGDGDKAGGQNGETCQPDEPDRSPCLGEEIQPEDIDRDHQEREHAGLHDSDGMEER